MDEPLQIWVAVRVMATFLKEIMVVAGLMKSPDFNSEQEKNGADGMRPGVRSDVAVVVGCERHCDWHSLCTEKAATNGAEVPRTRKDVVKPNGHIRGLMFATPKQPLGEQCSLL